MIINTGLEKSLVAILTRSGIINGTGFFITPQGHILTCYHVIKPMIEHELNIKIKLDKNTILSAKIENDKSNESLDIAILKVEGKGNYPCIRLGTFFEQGDEWCTIGYPLSNIYPEGLENSGKIIGIGKKEADQVYDIRLAALGEIRGGVSGSPVFDKEKNRIIGIIKKKSQQNPLEAYAISIKTVFETWPELDAMNCLDLSEKIIKLFGIDRDTNLEDTYYNYLNSMKPKIINKADDEGSRKLLSVLDDIMDAASAGNFETQYRKLEFAEQKLMQIINPEKGKNFSNYYVAIAHLYLSIIYILRLDQETSARHVLRIFIAEPRVARKEIGARVFDDLFRPKCDDVFEWYKEEIEAINKNDFSTEIAKDQAIALLIGIGAGIGWLLTRSTGLATGAAGALSQIGNFKPEEYRAKAKEKLDADFEKKMDQKCRDIASSLITYNLDINR